MTSKIDRTYEIICDVSLLLDHTSILSDHDARILTDIAFIKAWEIDCLECKKCGF